MINSIEIVLVLYNCTLEDSITFLSLKNQLKNLIVDYELLIYNNDKNINIIEPNYIVINSIENKKLAGAYNFALDKAIRGNKSWLLLLDQDTEIPDNYLDLLQNYLQSNNDNDLVAVVPVLMHKTEILSPKIINSYIWQIHDIGEKGYVSNQRIIAFNSMSLLKVNFIKSINGFSTNYPLDMLDAWYYNKIFLKRKKVYVLDIDIKHNLSVTNYEKMISIDRHREFLQAEALFVKELNCTHQLSFKIKLIFRSLKQFIKYKNKNYAVITLKKLFK